MENLENVMVAVAAVCQEDLPQLQSKLQLQLDQELHACREMQDLGAKDWRYWGPRIQSIVSGYQV